MKKLMEGWKRFLKENQEEEVLNDIKNITNQKMKYVEIGWEDHYPISEPDFFIQDEEGNWDWASDDDPIFLFSAWAIIDPMKEFKIDPKSIDDGYLLDNEVRDVFEGHLPNWVDISTIAIDNGKLVAALDTGVPNSLVWARVGDHERQISRPEKIFKKLAEEALAVDDLLQDPDFKNKLFTTLNRWLNNEQGSKQ